MSPRERAIQGFLERVVELWIEPDPFEEGHAAYLMRCVESYMGMTDEEFANRYLHQE